MKKVLVAFSANSVASREFLTGVFNYVNTGHNWHITLASDPYALTPRSLNAMVRNGIDGIVTGFSKVSAGYRAMLELGIPIAMNNFPPELPPPERANIAVLHNDELAIGRTAARVLRSRGSFRTYAFVTNYAHSFWSVFRERGFRLELARHRIVPVSLRRSRLELGAWLKSLPKPAAVFAAYDAVAAQVLEACKMERLRVPDHVAVIGVDNDDVICNAVRPTLSSIHPNHVELARRAAEELDRLMHGKRMSAPNPIFVPPLGVVERDSTRSVPPAGFLIREALAFIRENALKGISAKNVAQHLRVSESLARLRFRTVNGKSMRDEILAVRLAAVEKLLRTTNANLGQIAQKTGFSSACRLSHFFKTRHGVAPEIWRSKTQRQ